MLAVIPIKQYCGFQIVVMPMIPISAFANDPALKGNIKQQR